MWRTAPTERRSNGRPQSWSPRRDLAWRGARNVARLAQEDARKRSEENRREDLVVRYMPLARRIARTYHAPLHQEDIEQVAYLALVKAAKRFEPGRGHGFSTFAIPTIRGEIKHYLRDHSWDVHVPRLLQERAVRAQKVSVELTAELGRPPTAQELGARLVIGKEAALEALGAADARDAISLDGPPATGNRDRATGDLLEREGRDDEALSGALDRISLRASLALLSDLERQAVGLRYLADMTQGEIAKHIGISQMQVSRVLRRAIERIAAQNGGERSEPLATHRDVVASQPRQAA